LSCVESAALSRHTSDHRPIMVKLSLAATRSKIAA
jgi:endonuclease/exonuclease/phosphatase (EEP) superfamily protein YafD